MKNKTIGLAAVFFVISGVAVFAFGEKESSANSSSSASAGQAPTENIDDALNKIPVPDERRHGLITFINNTLEHKGVASYEELPYEYHGVSYKYNVNGKYLFVTEVEYGGAGSSYETTSCYIFDTELISLISNDSIFTNTSYPSLKRLIVEYLSNVDDFDTIDQEFLADPGPGVLFFTKGGIGMRWDRGSIAANAFGPFEIILPYSRAEQFLTQAGRDVFK